MAERILLVEDEEKLARMVELELQYEGYEVEKAFDGRAGLDRALSGEFDLVLLDIMLPALSGMEVLRRLRRESAMPVIMLTARDTVVDKVSGLDMGADDYITKPFAIEELLARIRAALRKRPAQAAEPPRSLLTAGPLTMDTDRHEVSSPAGSSICCATCWRTRSGSSPGSPCWTMCGASTSWGRPTQWTYTSAFCGPKSTSTSVSSSSTPSAAWAM